MKSICLLITLSLLLTVGCNSSKAPKASETEKGFTFAFLTDIHLQPELNAVAGFQKAIDTIIGARPDVILMDEPCSALDPIATARIEELIDELKEKYTIVIVTHSMHGTDHLP